MDFIFVGNALAQAKEALPGGQPSFIEQMFPLVIIFMLLYFIVIRPQAKKIKNQQKFLSELKVGDEVVTSSGIIGKVKSINERFISVDVGCGALKFLKEHLSGPMSQQEKAPKQSEK